MIRAGARSMTELRRKWITLKDFAARQCIARDGRTRAHHYGYVGDKTALRDGSSCGDSGISGVATASSHPPTHNHKRLIR